MLVVVVFHAQVDLLVVVVFDMLVVVVFDRLVDCLARSMEHYPDMVDIAEEPYHLRL
jgi:hypothetical protein